MQRFTRLVVYVLDLYMYLNVLVSFVQCKLFLSLKPVESFDMYVPLQDLKPSNIVVKSDCSLKVSIKSFIFNYFVSV